MRWIIPRGAHLSPCSLCKGSRPIRGKKQSTLPKCSHVRTLCQTLQSPWVVTTHTCTDTNRHRHSHTDTHTHKQTRIQAQTYAHVNTHSVCIHTYTHTQTDTLTHIQSAYMHTPTCTQTHTHTHTSLLIHKQGDVNVLSVWTVRGTDTLGS